MNPRIFTLLAAGWLAQMAAAESIDTATLGALDLQYTAVQTLDSYPGQPLSAQVSFRQGEGISLVTPHRIQQIKYLVEPGAVVSPGQAIAVLNGPEIHHFITEFNVTEKRLETAKKRFESNRPLYQQQAIDEGRWMEVSETFYALQLEYEHMLHFRELLQDSDDDEDSVVFTAPAEGVIRYQQDEPGIDAGEEIALLVPRQALRLRVSVPLAKRNGLVRLASPDCDLEVVSISGIARDFFVQAWSEPLTTSCGLLPGQRLMVIPVYKFNGYRVPRSAVFQWQGQPTVLLRKGQKLETVSVELHGSDAGNYSVSTAATIENSEVLSSSVSAVQGVLMGLGGE